MNRTLLWIANGALLVLCCFLAARVATAVAAEWLAPAPEARALPERSARPPASDWSDRRVILGRNLFNVSTLEPKPARAEEAEDLEETELPLELLGTAAAADPQHSWAAVKDLEEGTHRVVRVDDVLRGEARVLRIDRRRIVLQNGARREELALSEEERQSRPQRSARASATRRRAERSRERLAERVRRLGENRYEVPRSGVEEAANNPAALFSQARILPKYEDGTMVGVQLSSIEPGSLFEKIGIREGDTITEFNGIEVTGQQQSAQVLRELVDAREFDVTVTGRDGETRELRYQVR